MAAAAHLRDEMFFASFEAIRLLYTCFEKAKWSAECVDGQRLLRGLLVVFPDNKLVEDLHQTIRSHARANANMRMTRGRVQDLVTNSRVLETREIRHSSAVTEREFIAKFKRTKAISHA